MPQIKVEEEEEQPYVPPVHKVPDSFDATKNVMNLHPKLLWQPFRKGLQFFFGCVFIPHLFPSAKKKF